jgi:hypothetical protein
MKFPISDIASRFANGKTYPAYLAHMQKNRDTLEAITQEIQLSDDDVAFFSSLAWPNRALVVSEDWCPDCALNVPVLMHIAGASRMLEVRFVGRDDNLDVLEYAKKGDRKAIPTFLFFDSDWNEIGHWVERPVSVDAQLAAWEAVHPSPSEPDRAHEVWRRYRKERSTFRDELFFRHGAWRDTIAELRRILSREVFSNILELHAQA